MIKLPIETERLRLRRFDIADGTDLHAYLRLPETYTYEPGNPITVGDAWQECIDRSAGNNLIAVSLIDSNRLIGHLSFGLAEPAYVNTYELGYIFNPQYQRRGYCTEAVRALVKAAFATGSVHRIEARCDIRNVASSRVLEKSGFTREGLMRKQIYFRKNEDGQPLWVDAYLFAMLAEDILGTKY